MNPLKLKNVLDSHVHWLGTGEVESILNLKGLKSPNDIKSLKVTPECLRGDWVIGFGWDQNEWDNPVYPTREDLDKLFPDQPVAFSRVDGHALWVNSETLKRLGVLDVVRPEPPKGGKYLLDEQGCPTGVLIDTVMEQVWPLIPKSTVQDIKARLIGGMQHFNSQGITHIRDMSCDSDREWQAKCALDSEMSLFVEQWVSTENPAEIPQTLKRALEAKKDKLKNIQVMGVKIYFDGALGSDGALISEPYAHQPENRGLQLLGQKQFQEVLEEVWSHGLDVAIHSIGDESTDQISRGVEAVWNKGVKGRIHIEHAELVRPESLKRFLGKDVVFHMQPSHWLSDRKWLQKKLGDLAQYAFPWAQIEEMGFSLFFGSDSPIEPCDIFTTQRALKESAESGIAPIQKNWWGYHQHLDCAHTPDTHTIFENGQVKEVVYRGKRLDISQ